ncbi:MAG TPA: autotransporter-associated beta strand repeat-containing protein, partial [Pirellulales bacterium]
TLAFTAGNNNVLTGTAEVVVGSMAINGQGTVTMNNTNNYTGGTVITRGSTVNFSTGTGATNSPLGTGPLDVYGTLTGSSTDSLNGTSAPSSVTMHAGSVLTLVGAAGAADLLSDTAPLNLNGGTLNYSGSTSETIGALSYSLGSSLNITTTAITTPTLAARSGNATLVLGLASSGKLLVSGSTGPGTGGVPALVNTNAPTAQQVLPAYIVSSTGQFMTYTTAGGFAAVAPNKTAYAAGINAGTDLLQLTAAVQLVDNPTVWNLQTNSGISNAAGQFNTITMAGGGLSVTGAITIQPNLVFGSVATPAEAFIFNSSELVLDGNITASTITKSGAGNLVIASDQNYSGGWTINGGNLSVNTLGGLGLTDPGNVVTLTGGGTSGNGDILTFGGTANNGSDLVTNSSANFTFTSGPIVSVDSNTINVSFGTSGAQDRLETIAPLGMELQTTNGVGTPGIGDSRLIFNLSDNGTAALRSIVEVGASALDLSSATTASSTIVTVGSTTGLYVGELVGGANIPAGDTIASIVNGTTYTLATAATGTGSNSLSYTSALTVDPGPGSVQTYNPITGTYSQSVPQNVEIQVDTASVLTTNGVGGNQGQNNSSGVLFQGLNGIGEDITKTGPGYIYLPNSSASSWLSGTLTIAEGAVQVGAIGAAGDSHSTINVEPYGVLDIAAAGFRSSGITINELPGSVERWSANGAVTNGTVYTGVDLQVNADQTPTTPTTITMNGGSLEGFLRNDGNLSYVNHTLGPNLNIVMTGSIAVGQNSTNGANGIDNGETSAVLFTPTTQGSFNSTGDVVLDIQGNISESGGSLSLTKQGAGTVYLSGANTYSGGTIVTGGVLGIGQNNAILAGTALSVSAS